MTDVLAGPSLEKRPAEPGSPALRRRPDDDDRPRPLGTRTTDEVASLVGSALGSLAFVWVVYEHVLLWSGTIGFLFCWWLAFLALYAGVSALANPAPVVRDRLASAVVHSGAALVGLALASTIADTLIEGWPALHHWNFFTHDMAGVSPGTDPLTKGGVSHALVGTAVEVAIATVIALPLGIGTAVYLTEVGGRGSTAVRTVVESMTALPDILAGLFVYTLLIIGLGWNRTGLAAAIALAVTMVPVIARSAEVVLRVVPSGLREASLALGASRWRTVWNVVLPTAKSGTATALILGIARITGETAPLLIVSGSSSFFNADPTTNPMNSLPLFTFGAVRSGQDLYIQRGYGAAALLLTFVLTLFVITRFLARDKAGKR